MAALSRLFEGATGIVLAITGAVVAALGGGFVAAIDYRKLELGADLTEAEAIAEEAITRGRALEQERDRARGEAEALDRKRLGLIDANRTMREALEQVLLVPEATLDQAATTMLQAALRFLVASVGFEQDEEWAISVFQVQGQGEAAILHRIAAVRADRLTEQLDARAWGRNEGLVGAVWVGERDVIIENGDNPRVQEDYPVPAGWRREYDDRRYRSMAAVPVRLGPGPYIWGVVAASSDRAGRFRRDPGNRQVQTMDAVRGIARMMTLMAAALPIEREEEAIDEPAVAAIVRETAGYPYFLQEWGKHSWDAADRSPITAADVEAAGATALAELDASFFRVRFDRLAPAEKRYLRAMASLGPGPHRSGEVAERIGVGVSSVAPTRNSLIAKGMLYSPAHGDTAFTVPLFDSFIRRVMPDIR